MFAYYYEHANGNISKESLENNIYIGLNCGSFSYAEMPKTLNLLWELVVH